MANDTLITRIFAISPYVEIFGRYIYWKNISWLRKYGKKSRKQVAFHQGKKSDFAKIVAWMMQQGIQESHTILVHSAYEPLKSTGLQPGAIVQKLLETVGETGTLCMPATPILPKPKLLRDGCTSKIGCKELFSYNVRNSRIKTGALPKALLSHPNVIRSRHPINTMAAVGYRAKHYMEGNLDGASPLACGACSSWAKVVQDNGWVIGLGTDLTHSLTMIHVAEDLLDEDWCIPNWYEEKAFEISDGEFFESRVLRERLKKWGTLHFAERTLCKDLLNSNILKATKIDGITVELLSSAELLRFLQRRNKKGYPYYGLLKSLC